MAKKQKLTPWFPPSVMPPLRSTRRQEAASEPAQSGYWPVLFIAGLSIGAFALIVAYLQV